jgi:hypothetical protein
MKGVSIVGLSPGSRDMAFRGPQGLEMWSVNTGHACFSQEQLKGFTRWFQLHPRLEFESNNRDRPEHLQWLRGCGIPVYMEQEWPDIHTSIRYPRQEIVQKLGIDYFTSSIAYMIALAVYEGFEEIHLYGVDMPSETEYYHERPCVEFWLGYAHRQGIRVMLPEDCPLLKGKRYAETVNITSSHVVQKRRMYEQIREQKRHEHIQAIGMVSILETLVALRPEDEGLISLLQEKCQARDVGGAEFNAYAGAVQAMTELYIDALRPDNDEKRRLRSMAGDLLASQSIPVPVDGAVPGL